MGLTKSQVKFIRMKNVLLKISKVQIGTIGTLLMIGKLHSMYLTLIQIEMNYITIQKFKLIMKVI